MLARVGLVWIEFLFAEWTSAANCHSINARNDANPLESDHHVPQQDVDYYRPDLVLYFLFLSSSSYSTCSCREGSTGTEPAFQLSGL